MSRIPPKVQHHEVAFAHFRLVGRACGNAAFGPEATIVSKAGFSKPALTE